VNSSIHIPTQRFILAHIVPISNLTLFIEVVFPSFRLAWLALRRIKIPAAGSPGPIPRNKNVEYCARLPGARIGILLNIVLIGQHISISLTKGCFIFAYGYSIYRPAP
jgi:hypothetical protein